MKIRIDISAYSFYSRYVNVETIAKLRSELNQEKAKVLARIEERFRKQFESLDKIERFAREASTEIIHVPMNGKTIAKRLIGLPRVPLFPAAKQGARALGEFAKRDLKEWIQQNHSGMRDFNVKSLDKIVMKLISQGNVALLRANVGKVEPAVFKWIK
jgi:hypothetical protein